MVSYGAQHVQFRMLGVFGPLHSDPREIWGVGLRIFIGATALVEADKAEFLAAVKTAASAFHNSAVNKAPSSCWLTKLTAAYIGMDGKYVGGAAQPTTEDLYTTPLNGGGDPTMPFSHARVYTLRTDQERGRGSVGRIYYPSGWKVDSSGLWTAAECQQAADAFRTYVDAINTAARSVWSPASAVSVFSGMGTGEIGEVLTVQVGRAPDTQRRRDSSLPESYLSSDLATTLEARERRQGRHYD